MNYSPIQLEAIKIFGRKELTEGCLIRKEKWKWFKIANISDIKYPDWKICYKQAKWYWVHWKFYQPKFKTELDFEILWHEPHLEDVFRVAYEKWYWYNISDWHYPVFYNIEKQRNFPDIKWYNQTIRLLEQSEETLTQLINLFK